MVKVLFRSAVLLLSVGAAGAHAEVSGVYLGPTPDLVEMVQIIKTPDGRLAGRIESTSINEKGELSTKSLTIEGAADGNQIIVSAKSLLLHGDFSMTGFVDGNLLDLSWPRGHRTYQRGDAYAYESAITGLEVRAAQIRANASADQAHSEFTKFVEIVAAVESQSAETEADLKDASERFQKLYKKLHNRRRAAHALRTSGLNDGLAWNTEQEAFRLEREIWRLEGEIARIHRQFAASFDKAASLAASIQSHCADAKNSGSQNLCSEFISQGEFLNELKRNLQAAFDEVTAVVNSSSVDVPPGKRLLDKIAVD